MRGEDDERFHKLIEVSQVSWGQWELLQVRKGESRGALGG